MIKIYLTLAVLGIVAALGLTAANAGTTCYTTCNTMGCTTVCEP